MKNVPSLSRLLDVHLTAEIVDGTVTTLDHMQVVTVSIPTDDYTAMSGSDVEKHYLRPMVKALATCINEMGDVKTTALPEPKGITAFTCKKGKIPVTLTLVRRSDPDRHQLTLYALVEPVERCSED